MYVKLEEALLWVADIALEQGRPYTAFLLQTIATGGLVGSPVGRLTGREWIVRPRTAIYRRLPARWYWEDEWRTDDAVMHANSDEGFKERTQKRLSGADGSTMKDKED
jgi:hypothetical protein